ncbi:hypothetical protein SNOG_00226 [Parastagonospora nodorum SN15]|uniref:Uncharacterized protein n=1 Tax=Phaeosphaeria nodorum (strain SN15 / ATCC MYA-4574 / FGSC 10173) TaxID=321614 RepID=Q0V6Y8_PHANO|nr:hypothetical protein SNOG_00226 [Parastagonospora nodorum SN15]EAT91721.1 hypothetical protein SNOG_00226 [Parastagonospora nodorum SN15]
MGGVADIGPQRKLDLNLPANGLEPNFEIRGSLRYADSWTAFTGLSCKPGAQTARARFG